MGTRVHLPGSQPGIGHPLLDNHRQENHQRPRPNHLQHQQTVQKNPNGNPQGAIFVTKVWTRKQNHLVNALEGKALEIKSFFLIKKLQVLKHAEPATDVDEEDTALQRSDSKVSTGSTVQEVPQTPDVKPEPIIEPKETLDDLPPNFDEATKVVTGQLAATPSSEGSDLVHRSPSITSYVP